MSQRTDLIAGLAFLALGVGVCVEAAHLGFGSIHAPEPGFFPWIGGVLLTGLAVALLVRTWRSTEAGPRAPASWGRPVLLMVALAVYVPLLEPLGYPLVTAGLCIVALRILESRHWTATIAASLALALGSYLLFDRVLGVELPAGILTFLG